jgi:membrane protein
MPIEPPFAPFLARRLWPAADVAPPGSWSHRLRVPLRFVYAVARDVVEGRLTLHAASLVYTTILSLVPLIALGISVLKGFGVHYRFEPLLTTVLAPLGDQGTEVAERLMEFVEKMEVGVLGAVGLALLFYTAISVVQKVETAFNDIWHVRETRPLARKFTDYLSVLLIGPVLMFSAIALGTSLIASEPVRQLGIYEETARLLQFGEKLLPVVLVAAAFTFLYKFLPYTRVATVSAVVGGAVSALIWLIAGWAFAMFVAGAGSYTAIYSAFASLILFLLWLNVNWLILLIGAAIAFYHEHPEYMPLGPGPAILSNRCRERLALGAMQAIAEAQYAGLPLPTTADLRRRLRVPEETMTRMLTALADADLVTTTAETPPRWVALRPFESTDVKTLLDAIRRAGERRGLDLSRVAVDAPVAAVEERIDAAIARAVEGRRLKDLLNETDVAGDDASSRDDGRAAPAAEAARGERSAVRR